jgi:hypothetical protein
VRPLVEYETDERGRHLIDEVLASIGHPRGLATTRPRRTG